MAGYMMAVADMDQFRPVDGAALMGLRAPSPERTAGWRI
jgi:hypothetical protein